MPGIAVVGKDSAGGAQLGGGNDFFKVDGALAVVLADPVTPHPPPNTPPIAAPSMVQGSSFFKLNGIPVCIAGNQASCGHATSGQGFFRISE